MTPPPFTNAEMTRRLDLARGLARAHGVDALLVYGGGSRSAYITWLTAHQEMQGAQLVVPTDGDPIMHIAFLNHLPTAQERSRVTTKWGGHVTIEATIAQVQEMGLASLGIVGQERAGGFSYLDYLRLQSECPGLKIVDLSRQFDSLLLSKSEEEVAFLRESARLTDLALVELVDQARVGISEEDLVARMEFAYRRQGGDVGITFLRSMPMAEPNGIVPSQRPSQRKLEIGDVVICELSARYQGYAAQVLWPVFVGRDPDAQWQSLFDSAFGAYHGLCAAVRTGAPVSDAVAVGTEWISERGFTICDSLLHGCGLSLHPPYVDPDSMEGDSAAMAMQFERNMTVVLQPNPITRDERMGIQLGAAGVVRDSGIETLHHVPDAPLVARW